jgi:para-nitrobenzyl esterase
MRVTGIGWHGRVRAGAVTLAAAALSVAALAAAGPPAAASGHAQAGTGGPLAVTQDGVVQGTARGTTDEFLGIPYAAPPTGDRRWAPPGPAARWSGVRPATSFGAHCPQTASPFGQAAGTSEDCLFLNVYRPAGARPGRLPVMFWIHGGALVTGESDDYDPAQLVKRGVVVVTINYRLGALGFLADSALAQRDGGPSGNYGLMDQQAALRWVQRNITAFGGNPRNVTIFGESAGGLSVLSQVTSPAAHGLFAGAIVQSGAYALTEQPLAAAEQSGAQFAASVGCAQTGPAQVAACLRAVPVSTILAKQNASGYQPDIDGAVLHQSIGTALASGQFNRVPLVNGSNHDEWRLFVGLDTLEGQPPVTAQNYLTSIENELGLPQAAAEAVAREYPVANFPSAPLALGAAGTDAVFACPALQVDTDASRFVPVHAYEFADASAPQRFLPDVGFPYGAAHASEIQYLFGLSAAIPGPLTPAQQRLAAAMQGYWTSAARQHNPNTLGEPLWPAFSVASHAMISLVPPTPRVISGFAAEHHCAFWAALAQ